MAVNRIDTVRLFGVNSVQTYALLVDNLSPSQRTRSMRANTSTGTRPERTVRKLLRQAHIRFRSQHKQLPGTPDFVLTENNVALFVHGCFWHSHGCAPARLPATNKPYWKRKLARNVARDRAVKQTLRKAGWRPVTLWECQLRTLTPAKILYIITARKAGR